ncbi:MAG: rhodanese-like domain-containing protein [Beduini sp.]|uniref:rhodanese-like domain-containing protein n=1 Tax=Beduini sp. TaxID=1922300 RepID=UPI0039A29544
MEYKTITPQTAKEMIDHEKVAIVDVREEDEYAAMPYPRVNPASLRNDYTNSSGIIKRSR